MIIKGQILSADEIFHGDMHENKNKLTPLLLQYVARLLISPLFKHIHWKPSDLPRDTILCQTQYFIAATWPDPQMDRRQTV